MRKRQKAGRTAAVLHGQADAHLALSALKPDPHNCASPKFYPRFSSGFPPLVAVVQAADTGK